MLEIRGDLFTFGGEDENGIPVRSIHRITCLNRTCKWTTKNQKLKIARSYLMAIPVADSVERCLGKFYNEPLFLLKRNER